MVFFVNGRWLATVGEQFEWETLGGEHYEGTVEEVDSNVLYVRCTDGEIRAVEG